MRLIQWELYALTEFSRINPELYGCLSPSQSEGVLAPVSVGKMIIYVSGTAKGLLQQNLLSLVWIYSKFKCLVHANHSFLSLHLHLFYNYSKAVNAVSIRDFMDLATTYVRIVGFYFSRIWEIVVHRKPLRSRQFSCELLMLSHEHRLYLVRQHYLLRPTHFPPLGGTSLRRNSR